MTTNPALSQRRELRFSSGADRCHAWLYMPPPAADAGPPPVIVMAHGLGAVKQLRLAAFAERFQVAGYACLVFDYRHFGESEGEPRELLSLPRQREDWRAAVEFARSLPEVDPGRVVVWGTSFGGGHAIVTAADDDDDIIAAVVQCPFTDGLVSARQLSPIANARLGGAAAKDHLARLLGRPPVRVKVAARPHEVGLMDRPDVLEGVLKLLDASGLTEEEYRNDVPARVALEIPLDRLADEPATCVARFSSASATPTPSLPPAPPSATRPRLRRGRSFATRSDISTSTSATNSSASSPISSTSWRHTFPSIQAPSQVLLVAGVSLDDSSYPRPWQLTDHVSSRQGADRATRIKASVSRRFS
jgi:hypothetical protein